jgi:hypothetical protein
MIIFFSGTESDHLDSGFHPRISRHLWVKSEVINEHPMSKEAAYIYGGFHCMAWGLATGWVTFAYCRGNEGKCIHSLSKFKISIVIVELKKLMPTVLWA